MRMRVTHAHRDWSDQPADRQNAAQREGHCPSRITKNYGSYLRVSDPHDATVMRRIRVLLTTPQHASAHGIVATIGPRDRRRSVLLYRHKLQIVYCIRGYANYS